jgi:hypothetical protein
MVLCELHPAEKAALAAEFHRVPRVSVLELDGYIAVRGQLPCPERRALVLLDPPFESPDEWRQLVDAVTTGVARMPGATFAIWYPVTQRARVDAFLAELERHPLPPTWCAEVTIAGEDAGLKMRGSGMVVVNPPWQLDLELGPVLAWLAQVLARAPGADADGPPRNERSLKARLSGFENQDHRYVDGGGAPVVLRQSGRLRGLAGTVPMQRSSGGRGARARTPLARGRDAQGGERDLAVELRRRWERRSAENRASPLHIVVRYDQHRVAGPRWRERYGLEEHG